MTRLMPLVMLVWLVIGGVFASSVQAARPQQSSDQVFAAPSSTRTVLGRYCVACHNEGARVGGLVLEHIDVNDVGGGAATWERVIRKLRTGAMPPAGRPRPDPSTVQSLVVGLETALDRVAAVHPDPGRTTVHRLNRVEYANAVRDLLHFEVDSRALLPPDIADKHGFDNIADALSVSPVLLERYMSAARQVSRLAVGASPGGPGFQTYTVSERLNQDYHLGDDFPFGSRGGIAVQHDFPVDGEYVIQVRLVRNNYGYVVGLGRPHRLEVHLDRARIGQLTVVGGAAKGAAPPLSFAGAIQGDPEWENYTLDADTGLEIRFPVRAGQRLVTVSFVNDALESEGPLQPREGLFADTHNEKPYKSPGVERILIGGPFVERGPGDTPSRRRIFQCRPRHAADEEPCAQRILADLARRAYRRPATEEDVRTLLDFYREGWREKDFEAGIQLALERLLVDPDFLFRIEWEPRALTPGQIYRVGDLDLASRLSFFLWSSIPDDELLDVAVAGQLRDRAVLERQVHRMIADPKAKALVSNFAGQWLELRNIREVAPDPEIFPDFDGNLQSAFREETELFVESQVREDRGLMDLLTANYTFVNDRLASHYGIPHVYGSRFRRVTLEGGSRGGLLGHGSILTVTSLPNRTSAVLRGKWFLDNVLGTPPPPPPPDVPALDDEGADERPRSMRDRLEQHRRNPVCASCHARMDPLGFAMENFDAIGAWRTSEAGRPIDASGAMPDGRTFNGPAGLRELLVADGEQFVTTVTEKLLAYALGRGLEHYDQPAVRKIVRESAASDYRWSSILLGIVNSTPFQMRRAAS